MLPEPQATSFLNNLAFFEGEKNFMYLDGAKPPNVTCAIGHLVATAEDAAALPFTGGDAAQDWVTVRAASPGLAADAYEAMTTSRLTTEAMAAICGADVVDRFSQLARAVPWLPGCPANVQAAMLDIQYNVSGGVKTFPRMLAAGEVGDWVTMAAESERIETPAPGGVQPARNAYVKALILSAIESVT